MMRRVCLWVLLLISACVIALPISYQGKLTDLAGIGVNDTMDIALAIYDDPSAGTLVDADTVSAVIVYHGLFSETFDITIPSSYLTGDLYIQIAVDTSMTGATWTALSPRQLVTTAFRAMWTDNSVNAVYADTATYVLASNVAYDNTASGLSATDVQSAIDELAGNVDGMDLQSAYDNGNTITGDNSVSITLNPGHGRALYAKVGKDGASASSAAAIYAWNDSTGPAIYANGNIVQAAGKYIGTNGDVRVLLDINNNSEDHFRVYNADTNIVFDVDEYGFASAAGSLEIGNVPDDAVHDSVLTIADGVVKKVAASEIGGGGTVNDSNFIQNQDTVAQPAKFWVKNKGVIGGVTSYGDEDIITGTGTSNSGFYPIADWYHYSRTVSLIRADEIGVGGACTLDTISIYLDDLSATDPWTFDSVYIWLELTTDDSVPANWDVTGATQVFYSVAVAVPQTATGWYHFDITDFPYDGTSNLLIYFQNGYQSTNYGSDGPDWRYTTQPTNRYFAYAHSDGSWETSLNNSTSRPDFRLSFVNVPTIVDKVEIENGEVRADNEVEIGGVGLTTDGGAGLIGYDNSTSGLTATDVQGAIDEIYGEFGSADDYIKNQMTSPQDAHFWISDEAYFGSFFSLDSSLWCESFESVSDSTTPPTGWSVVDVNGSAGEVTFEHTTKHPSGGTPSDGSILVRFNSWTASTDMSCRLFQTAGVDVSGVTTEALFVVFDLYHDSAYSGSNDRVTVQYSTDGGTTWNDVQTYKRYDGTTGWETGIMCELPSAVLTATDLRIALLFISGYGNDVYVDHVCLQGYTENPQVSIDSGDVYISGKLTVDGGIDPTYVSFTPQATAPTMPSPGVWVDTSTPNKLYYWNGTANIDLTTGGGGGTSLDGAYDYGSPGGGRTITADSGPVVVDASGASNGALNVIASDAGNASLYINHTGGGNGIWNDANYWSPSGNVAIGTGYFHTDTGWFQSNTDFICKIDADDNADNVFQVQNSAGSVMFEVDEYGNVAIANDLLIATGGIHDGVGTGSAGQVLTADGTGHFHWGTNSDNDWDRTGNLLTTHNITDSVGIGVAAPLYKLHVEGETNDDEAVGYFKNTSSPGDYIDGYGVYGECANDDYYGTGVYGVGGYIGVEGDVYPTGSDYYYGVYGYVEGGNGQNYGVVGDVYGDGVNYGVYAYATDNGSGTSNNYGIYAYASGGDTNWAAYLDGDVYVDAGIDLNGVSGGVPGANTYRDDWEPGNVITVSRTNADFSDLKEAIDTANNIGNIVIKIAPGAYTLSAADSIIASVVLMGSGKGITTISGSPLTIMSSVQNIGFQNDITLSGKAMNCNFNGNVEISGGTAINCNFDNAGGTDTLGLTVAGEIEQCDFSMAIDGEGIWTISDCKFNLPANFHPPVSGITEVHIDGCDVFATITITGSGTFGYFESNKFFTGDGGAGISVGDDGSAEIKANHFVDCIVGVSTGANSDVTIQSNDFIGCFSFGIYALDGKRLDVIGNNIAGIDATVTGMSIDGVGRGAIKDNKIEKCTGDGIVAQNMNFVIDNNVCIDNGGNGILINNGLYQIVHNTLVYNGDGTTTFDLNDASTTPSSAASYNVLDTYSPAGTGAWSGAFNTQSSGLIWPGGAQLGQLP